MMERVCVVMSKVAELPPGVSIVAHVPPQHTCYFPALAVGQGGKEYLLKEDITDYPGTSL